MECKKLLISTNPGDFHDYSVNLDNNNYTERKQNNILKEKSELFWKNYFSYEKYSFCKEDIKVYDDVIPQNINDKLSMFLKSFAWLYGYKNNESTTLLNYSDDHDSNDDDNVEINEHILKQNEIQCFYGNVIKNQYFETLFYQLILPSIDIENKENIKIDRAHIISRLHNLSEFFHKDERSTIKYGPSVYVYLNADWKTYYDGLLSFALDINNIDIHHVHNKMGRIIVFPPNIYHKMSEVSGYALFENKMSMVLEYHLIYE
jgi:hypothetical protein|uniref:Prolyl 4-hydroxylase alpha subunit Fe(2+) 2OG dioxygenase domain-containing protein n=1 Tax=viral metagenome TaxID=1070528 RepID=A0A6C0JFP5_9ZZZZ